MLEELVRHRQALPPPPVRRLLRKTAGVSLQAVADHVGVSRQAIFNWETGAAHPTGENLTRYLDALEILRGSP